MSATRTTTHFTAIIKIVQVTSSSVIETNSAYGKQPQPSQTLKERREVASIVVRAKDVETLVAKTTQHLALVDDAALGFDEET